jgi:hypothetical protein
VTSGSFLSSYFTIHALTETNATVNSRWGMSRGMVDHPGGRGGHTQVSRCQGYRYGGSILRLSWSSFAQSYLTSVVHETRFGVFDSW